MSRGTFSRNLLQTCLESTPGIEELHTILLHFELETMKFLDQPSWGILDYDSHLLQWYEFFRILPGRSIKMRKIKIIHLALRCSFKRNRFGKKDKCHAISHHVFE